MLHDKRRLDREFPLRLYKVEPGTLAAAISEAGDAAAQRTALRSALDILAAHAPEFDLPTPDPKKRAYPPTLWGWQDEWFSLAKYLQIDEAQIDSLVAVVQQCNWLAWKSTKKAIQRAVFDHFTSQREGDSDVLRDGILPVAPWFSKHRWNVRRNFIVRKGTDGRLYDDLKQPTDFLTVPSEHWSSEDAEKSAELLSAYEDTADTAQRKQRGVRPSDQCGHWTPCADCGGLKRDHPSDHDYRNEVFETPGTEDRCNHCVACLAASWRTQGEQWQNERWRLTKDRKAALQSRGHIVMRDAVNLVSNRDDVVRPAFADWADEDLEALEYRIGGMSRADAKGIDGINANEGEAFGGESDTFLQAARRIERKLPAPKARLLDPEARRAFLQSRCSLGEREMEIIAGAEGSDQQRKEIRAKLAAYRTGRFQLPPRPRVFLGRYIPAKVGQKLGKEPSVSGAVLLDLGAQGQSNQWGLANPG